MYENIKFKSKDVFGINDYELNKKKSMNDQKKIKDYEYLKECCLYPHSGKSLKVLNENEGCSYLEKEDIIKLIEVLKRYVV